MAYPAHKVKVLNDFLEYFTRFKQIIVVDLINISTKQIVNTRMSLRKTNSIILVGKNNLAKLAIKILTTPDDKDSENYELQKKYGKRMDLVSLNEKIVGKIGFVFSDLSYIEMKELIEKEKVKTTAKIGMIAPSDIVIPAGPTSLDPGRIIEFQRLGILTKINKNAIEITKDFSLCKKDDIVTATVSSMCKILNIVPFEFSMSLKLVFLDGVIIPQEVIQIKTEDMLKSISQQVTAVTAVSLEAGLTNSLTIGHVVRNTFNNILAIGLEANLKFKQLEDAMNAQAAGAAAPASSSSPKKTEAKKVEEEVEEEADMDMGDLFG